MKTLFFALIFSSALYAQPSLSTSEDITLHDVNNDGFATFDLTQNSCAVLDGLAQETQKISYHLTFNDADLNRNPIQKPKAYTNKIQYSQELYVRVTNIANPSYYSVELFTIQTHNSPELNIEARRQ